MADIVLDGFIGQGITFPIQLDSRGAAIIDANTDIVRKSILSIINWPLATRFFNNHYGSRIEHIMDEPNDAVLMGLLNHFVLESITTWEARATNLRVSMTRKNEYTIDVFLKYTLVNTQKEDSFVFPFYNELTY